MPERYYDVVVLGRSLGALTAAALLARRDFTVLLVGGGRAPADYLFDGLCLRRRAFTMLAASSPVWGRIVGELAYSQSWQRRVVEIEPMLQVIAPGRRFDVSGDAGIFDREVEREFPEARRLVAELYADLARVNGAADAAFERDAVWPPGRFLERRETGRVAASLPYARAEPHADLLAEFPRGHLYRRVVTESVRFATDLASLPPAFAVARLHGAWTRGLVALPGGEQELDRVLLERIEANGGRCLLAERPGALDIRRGGVAGVLLDGDSRPIGAGFVITDLGGEELAALSGGDGISKRAQRDWPRVHAPVGRFVVSVVATAAAIPAMLAGEALVLGGPHERTLHLQCVRAGGTALCVVELLLSEGDPLPRSELRRHVLERLCRELPFLEQHLLAVDSVHDGLPLWRYRDGVRTLVERSEVAGAAVRAEPMDRQLDVDPPGYLALAGEPIRGPIDRTLLVGPSVLPGLGQEGRLLAACSAARLVTQSDRRKARMRREMWTKLEIS